MARHGLAAPWHRRGDRRAAARRRRRCIREGRGSVQRPRLHQERHRGRRRGRRRPAGVGARPRPRSTCRPTRASSPTRASRPYKAVVFLNTTGDVLDAAQEAAFEKYFRAGGGFLGIGSAIETEPELGSSSRASSARARRGSRPTPQQATIKVADRGHAAGGKVLPEYWQRTDRWYNFAANVRGVSHVIATVDEKTYTGGNTMGAARRRRPTITRSSGARTTRAAAPSTPRVRQHRRRRSPSADFRKHLSGAVQWAAGKADPVYSDCGATVLANYQQTKISAPPNLNEPIGFDQLPDGRIIQTARAGQVRLHDPAKGTTQVIATSRSTPTPRTASTARRSTTTSPPTSGSTCTTRRRPSASRSATARWPTSRPRPARRRPRRRPVRLDGHLGRLLPALALQVRRRRDAVAGPRDRAEDHPGPGQPRRVLPRRRRHRLRQEQQPVVRHG